jgi:hypothetical protein
MDLYGEAYLALWQIDVLHDKQVLGRDTLGVWERMLWRELAVITVLLKPEEMIQEMGAPDMMVSYRTQAPIIMGAQCTRLTTSGKKRTQTIS